jgi:hypothetical protein
MLNKYKKRRIFGYLLTTTIFSVVIHFLLKMMASSAVNYFALYVFMIEIDIVMRIHDPEYLAGICRHYPHN